MVTKILTIRSLFTSPLTAPPGDGTDVAFANVGTPAKKGPSIRARARLPPREKPPVLTRACAREVEVRRVSTADPTRVPELGATAQKKDVGKRFARLSACAPECRTPVTHDADA